MGEDAAHDDDGRCPRAGLQVEVAGERVGE